MRNERVLFSKLCAGRSVYVETRDEYVDLIRTAAPLGLRWGDGRLFAVGILEAYIKSWNIYFFMEDDGGIEWGYMPTDSVSRPPLKWSEISEIEFVYRIQ